MRRIGVLPSKIDVCSVENGVLFAALCVDSFLKGSEFGGDGFTDYQDSVISDRPKASAKHVINADATQTNGMFFVFHMLFGRLSGSRSTFCVAADGVCQNINPIHQRVKQWAFRHFPHGSPTMHR